MPYKQAALFSVPFPPLRKALGHTRQDKAGTTLVPGCPAVTYRRTTQKDRAFARLR